MIILPFYPKFGFTDLARYNMAMTTENKPFSRKGGIERSLGSQNKAAAAAFMDREIRPIPEDPNKTAQARSLQPLSAYDLTMRFVRPDSKVPALIGALWVSTIRPGEKPTQEGLLVERWSEFDSIGSARHALNEHIADAYDKGGREHRNRLDLIRQINYLMRRFQQGPLTDDELTNLRNNTVEVAYRAKYLTSVIPERRETGGQVIKAVEKDSRGQINPPRNRLILAQERDDIITDLMLDEVKLNKNRERVVRLDTEIDFEELILEAFAKRSRVLAERRIGTGSFSSGIDEYLIEAHNMLSPGVIILVKPYSDAAAKIRYLLFARNNTTDAYALAKYIGVEAITEFTQDFVPFSDLSEEQQIERLLSLRVIIDAAIKKRKEDQDPKSKEKTPKPPKVKKIDAFWAEVEEKLG